MTAYVALMSVQYVDTDTGEYKIAQPVDPNFHGVFEGLDDKEAERLVKLGAIREPDEDELAIYKAQGDQTVAVEKSEVQTQLEADAEAKAKAEAAAAKGKGKAAADADKDVIG